MSTASIIVRTRVAALALMCWGIPLAGMAQEEPDARAGAPMQSSYPGGVVQLRDVVFSTPDGYRPITLDLYRPPVGSTPKPALVFVHGGSWRKRTAREGGTFRDFPSVLASLAARGYVVASVNYRLSKEAKFPAQIHDVQNAIRWLRDHAADHNVDVNHIAVWGSSAGGHIAALIGTSCGVAALSPPDAANAKTPRPSACVQAVVDWYGVIDLEMQHADYKRASPTAEGDYLGCEPDQCKELARRANPIAHIDATDPPFLIQHGSIDATVLPKQGLMLHDALRAARVPSQFVLYPDVAHGFARMPGWQVDEAVNKKALDDMVEFLDRQFSASSTRPVALRKP